MTTMDDLLLCLNCFRNLTDGELETADDPTDPDYDPTVMVRRCECGVRYSQALLNVVDHQQWARALRRDGFIVERKGDAMLVVIDRGGRRP